MPDGYQEDLTPITQTHDVSFAVLFAANVYASGARETGPSRFRSGGPGCGPSGMTLRWPGCPRSEGMSQPFCRPSVRRGPAVVSNAETRYGLRRAHNGACLESPALSGSRRRLTAKLAAISWLRHAYQGADPYLTKHPSGTPGHTAREHRPGTNLRRPATLKVPRIDWLSAARLTQTPATCASSHRITDRQQNFATPSAHTCATTSCKGPWPCRRWYNAHN